MPKAHRGYGGGLSFAPFTSVAHHYSVVTVVADTIMRAKMAASIRREDAGMRMSSHDPSISADDRQAMPAVSDDLSEPVKDAGNHLVLFWLLIGMAFLVYAPCILVPIWLETEHLIEAERKANAHVAELQANVAEQDRVLDALRSDPLLNERLARRDLRFHRASEVLLPGAANDEAKTNLLALHGSHVPEPQPIEIDDPPVVISLASRWLPALPWKELFATQPNRTIFMLMAGGLLVAAFWLFGHHEQGVDDVSGAESI
jgi:hypothetical protein